MGLDGLLQFRRAILRRGQLAQQAGERVHFAQRIQRAVAEVQVQVQVDDAVGGSLVVEHLYAVHFGFFRVQQHGIGADLGQIQHRQGRQLLGAVGGLLPGVELLVHVENGSLLLRRPGRCGSLQLRGLLSAHLLAQGGGGQRVHHDHVVFLQKQVGEQRLKAAVLRHLADFGHQVVVDQAGQRIAVVQPGVQRHDAAHQAGGLVGLADAEFVAVDGGSQHIAVDALLHQLAAGAADDVADGRRVLILDIADGEHHDRLGDGAVSLHAHILAQAGGQQRALEGRLVGAHQHVGEDVRRRHAGHILPGADDLAQGQHGLVLRAVRRGDLVVLGLLAGMGGLHGDDMLFLRALKAAEVAVDHLQHLIQRHRAIQPDAAVGGVVVAVVHGHVLLVGQLGDHAGVSAGVEAVAVVREAGRQHALHDDLVHRGHGALHLIEHHALVGGGAVRVLHLNVPALLVEDIGVGADGGGKDGVQVHFRQVHEVLIVAAGHGVHGLVREGHGVEEGIHGGLEQLHEGLLHRELVAAAKHGMLQDMEHAGGILGQGLESDGKQLVRFAVIHPHQLRAGLVVGHFDEVGAQLCNFTHTGDGEAVQLLAGRQGHNRSTPFRIMRFSSWMYPLQ